MGVLPTTTTTTTTHQWNSVLLLFNLAEISNRSQTNHIIPKWNLAKQISDPNFVDPKIFWPNCFLPTLFVTQKNFWPKFFLTQKKFRSKFCWPKKISDQILFYPKKIPTKIKKNQTKNLHPPLPQIKKKISLTKWIKPKSIQSKSNSNVWHSSG